MIPKHIGVPVQRVNEIVRGKRGVTPETAWLFAEASRGRERMSVLKKQNPAIQRG